MRTPLCILIAAACACLTACSTIGSRTIDIALTGELRFETPTEPDAFLARTTFTPGLKHPRQLSPFPPVQAELQGIVVKAIVSTVVVSITIENPKTLDFQIDPSAGIMWSNLINDPKPLACVNPSTMSDDQAALIAATRKIDIKKAQKELQDIRDELAKANAIRPSTGNSWRYFCGGPSYKSIFPSGYIFNFTHDSKKSPFEMEKGGVGNAFNLSMPMVFNGNPGILALELKATDAKARLTYY
jgi:hypothetical protein